MDSYDEILMNPIPDIETFEDPINLCDSFDTLRKHPFSDPAILNGSWNHLSREECALRSNLDYRYWSSHFPVATEITRIFKKIGSHDVHNFIQGITPESDVIFHMKTAELYTKLYDLMDTQIVRCIKKGNMNDWYDIGYLDIYFIEIRNPRMQIYAAAIRCEIYTYYYFLKLQCDFNLANDELNENLDDCFMEPPLLNLDNPNLDIPDGLPSLCLFVETFRSRIYRLANGLGSSPVDVNQILTGCEIKSLLNDCDRWIFKLKN